MLSQSSSALINAELDYAHFNALRTSAKEDTSKIRREICKPFSCIIDPTKKGYSYLNRGVLHTSANANERDIAELPEEICGIELPVGHSATAISAAGFHPGTQLIYLASEPVFEREVVHRVERFTSDQTDDFFDLLEKSGAEFSEKKRTLKAGFYCTETFRCHVSFSEMNEPTGWATSFLCADGESAFMANAFTLPEFRGRGFHSALINTRLNEVITLGRKRAFTDVEPDSISLRNCERFGFHKISETIIWER